MTTLALSTILERASQNLWPNRPHKLTATGGTATTFVDSKQIYASAPANLYDGAALLVTANADNAGESPEGDLRRITRGGFAGSTGTFTVDTWSTDTDTVIEASDTAILLYGLDDNEIVECANEIVRTMKMDRYTPLSLTTDPGMDASGTSGYTAIGAATLAKTASVGLVYTGSQGLSVTCGADEGVITENIYLDSAGIPTWETGVFYVSTIVKQVLKTTWDVILNDRTNNQTIYKVDLPTDTGNWYEVRFEATPPAGARSLDLRFVAAESGSSLAIDSISLLHSEQRYYKLPAQVADGVDVIGIAEMPESAATNVQDVFIPFSQNLQDIPFNPLSDLFAVHENRIEVPAPRGNPYWIKYRGAGTELSFRSAYTSGGAASTAFSDYFAQTVTVPDEDTFMAGLLAECSLRLGDRQQASRWSRIYHEKMSQKQGPIISMVPTPRTYV